MNEQTKVQKIYEKLKRRIEIGELASGDRLPSIRQAAEDFGVSKGTVEIAYTQLELEGYVSAAARSGYYVREIDFLDFGAPEMEGRRKGGYKLSYETELRPVGHLRASDGICAEDFDYRSWRKEICRILDYRSERLSMVPEIRGESELRAQIARFVSMHRDVFCMPEQVVIASGTQILLSMLAARFRELGITRIAFEHPGFRKGAQVFEAGGIELSEVSVGADGICVEELRRSGAKVVYVSPAHQFPSGAVMSIANRMKLLKWAEEVDGMILEDDYDGILRYAGSPIPALQGLSRRDDVIYLGSFSKLLSPSIRISFMVLPRGWDGSDLPLYNQSASKLDQLALAAWMADGTMDRHLRRLRKAYKQKAIRIVRTVEEYSGGRISPEAWESGTYLVLRLRGIAEDPFAKVCSELGLSVQRLDPRRWILSYSGIEEGRVEELMRCLCEGAVTGGGD